MQAHICISGFTQHCGRNNGLVKLSERLSMHGYADGPGSRVMLHPWRSDWSHVAEYLWLLENIYEQTITVGIYAYSWGAGYGATSLARELRERGITVRGMVLSDPVPRPILPLRWMAMVPAGIGPLLGRRIRIPDNVREVWHFRQTQNTPQGHPVVADDPDRTTVHPGYELHRTHQYMDDAAAFHDRAESVAATIDREAL